MLYLQDNAFEFLVENELIGARRILDDDAVKNMREFIERYHALVGRENPPELLTLGRELYERLNGPAGQLDQLRQKSPPPFTLEVSATAQPSEREALMLRLPFEILADADGFLANDALRRFCTFRRLRQPSAHLPPLEGYRLGLAFMAAAPRGQHELDYEAEELAILNAVRRDGTKFAETIDLLVEETGDLAELGSRLESFQALHLSCHGFNIWRPFNRPDDQPQPVLFLEDEKGNAKPTPATALLAELRASLPRFLFLSACLSAADIDVRHLPGGIGRKDAQSTTEKPKGLVAEALGIDLVKGGVPAVLGWEGSVTDSAATYFAAKLYADLARPLSVAEAVENARRALLQHENERLRADWHLARLWVNEGYTGPIADGRKRRAQMSAQSAEKIFLDAKKEVPVAAPAMFVGRRRQLQTALRTLRDAQYGGVIIQGMGRQGKSSLATRIARRLKDDFELAVLFGRYDALSCIEVLETTLRTIGGARELLRDARAKVRDEPGEIEFVLLELFRLLDEQAKPVLFVIDDFERVLEAQSGKAHHVKAERAPTLAAILRAFDPTTSGSRLIVTTRYAFALDGLEENFRAIALPPLSPTSQHKLELRQAETALEESTKPLEDLEGRLKLLATARDLGRGNPGFQDLMARELVLRPEISLDHAERDIESVRAWLHGGSLPDEPVVRNFLENLSLNDLLNLAGMANVELLRALTIFVGPVPRTVFEAVITIVGGNIDRLEELGLVEPFEDHVDAKRPALAVNGLIMSQLKPLKENEIENTADAALSALVDAWGGFQNTNIWQPHCHFEAAQLALKANDPETILNCGSNAMIALRLDHAKSRTQFGEAMIALLDRRNVVVPLDLLAMVIDAAATSGDGKLADAFLERADVTDFDPLGDIGMIGALLPVLDAKANRLYERGEYQEALAIRKDLELPVYQRLGNEYEIAVTKGKIASILVHHGKHEEALCLRQDEQLPVFERLGNVRSVATTQCAIAEIFADRCDYDSALRVLQDDTLPIFHELGDASSFAATQSKISDIFIRRGEYRDALHILQNEVIPVHIKYGEVRLVAINKGKMANVLIQMGEYDSAYRILNEEVLPDLTKLDDAPHIAIAHGRVADILFHRGKYSEALNVRQEKEMPVFQRLGRIHDVAMVQGKIADILAQSGKYYEAIKIREEDQIPVLKRLGNAHSVAIAQSRVADIFMVLGEFDKALSIRQDDELTIYRSLGDERSEAMTRYQIGHILMLQGKLAEARTELIPSLETCRKLDDIEGVALAQSILAQLDLSEQNVDDAYTRLAESFSINLQLGLTNGIAVVGSGFGRLLASKGNKERAREVLRISARSYREIERSQEADKIEALLKELGSDD